MSEEGRVRGIFERERGSGVWWIRYADHLGTVRYQKIGPKPLAIAAYQKRKTEVREGKLFPNLRYNRVRFGELCDGFKRAKPNHWSIAGKGSSRGDLLHHVKEWFEGRPAALVSPQHIEEKLNDLIKRKRSAATANRYRCILSAIFSWAVKNDRLASNPVRSVGLRREENRRMRFLEASEETALRTAIAGINPAGEPVLTLALHTGMRLGEQRSLTWPDVDLARGFIYLRKTKSGKPRAIPLNAEALQALIELRERRRGSDLVCPAHPRWWFEQATEKARLGNFRWHDLRHTFASRLVMAGVDLRTVQELMGHEGMAMTLRYAHLAPKHLRAAVEAISAAKPAAATETTTETASPKRQLKSTASA